MCMLIGRVLRISIENPDFLYINLFFSSEKKKTSKIAFGICFFREKSEIRESSFFWYATIFYVIGLSKKAYRKRPVSNVNRPFPEFQCTLIKGFPKRHVQLYNSLHSNANWQSFQSPFVAQPEEIASIDMKYSFYTLVYTISISIVLMIILYGDIPRVIFDSVIS